MRDFDIDESTWHFIVNGHVFFINIKGRRKPIELLRIIRWISALADGERNPYHKE